MKKQTMTQYMLLLIVCIACSFTGGITQAAAEEDGTPCKAKFYYSPDQADSNMLGTTIFYDEDGSSFEEPVFHAHGDTNVFYMYLDQGSADSIELLSDKNEPSGDEDPWWGEAKALRMQPYGVDEPILVSIEEENPLISVEAVDGKEGWYQVTLHEALKENFGLSLEVRTVGTADYTDEEGKQHTDSWVDGSCITLYYHDAPLSVVNDNDPNEFGDVLEGNPTLPIEFSIRQIKTADGKVTFEKVSSPDALDVLAVTEVEGGDEMLEHIEMADPETYTLTADNGSFSFTSNVEGKYYLVPKDSYPLENADPEDPASVPEHPIQIEVWLPFFGFFSTPEATVDTWLGNEIAYREPQISTMYIVPYINENDPWAADPNTIRIAGYDHENNGLADYISITKDTEHPNIYQITITDKAAGDFKIIASAKRNGYGSQEDPDLSEIITETMPVKSILKDIQIKTAPAKTTYTEGESFDKTGMVVEAVYNDDTSYPITDYTLHAPAQFAVGDKEVSISWRGKTKKQAVTVNAKMAPPQPTWQPQPTAKAEVKGKVGDSCVFGGNTYQITAVAADKKEAAYKGGDKKAKKVSIPSSITINGTSYRVTEIAANSFSGNKKLTGVTIPATVSKIGNNAFKNCSSLTKVKIPKNVISIGKNAFRGCKKIKRITISSTKIKSIGKNAFQGISSKATIKVPKNKKKAYTKLLRKAGWKGKIK